MHATLEDMMRLDRYLTECTDLTRSMAKSVLARGEVTLNGEMVKSGSVAVNEGDCVQWQGETLQPVGLRYIMLHKPAGYECSTRGGVHPSVLDLIDVEKMER